MSDELLQRARRSLSRRDPVLRPLIRAVGACALRPRGDLFACLVRSIISQQISTKAAQSISGRLVGLCGGTLSAAAIVAASDEALRGAGLSAAKLLSLRDLAGRVHSGTLVLDELPQADDEEAIARLVPVRGIGRWTAQMLLIFSLGRLDVLPVDDLGLRVAVQRRYGLAALPRRAEVEEIGAKWRPYRSVATWYLWRSLELKAV